MAIQFEDELDVKPIKSIDQHASGVDRGRDVVFSRTISNTSRFSKNKSDWADGDDEEKDSGIRRESDYKQKQIFTGSKLLFLAYQSIGTIYGDIGTSPLYVFSSTFPTGQPSHADLIGALSLVIWSMTMMVTIKYVCIVLRADNQGEGGSFSCFSLLSRYAHITKRDPREASLVKMERYDTQDIPRPNRKVRSSMERSRLFRGLLKVIGVLAVSMVMSDGVLTPAQSVLGAVQGINVAAPGITKPTIVGTTCAILVLLFFLQPLGIHRLGAAFAPIVIIWLGFNGGFGIYNLIQFDHSVLKACNPGEAFMYLIRNKEAGWHSLGGILLCFTGVEALFADLGAFSMRAIQISWLCWTFPCLLLAYSGQAAYISVHADAVSNPFFKSVPPGMLYPSLVMAILAAIVASQAIITATFQLVAQITKLSYFPQIKVVHTSNHHFGQVYVPMVNWLLMIGTVMVAAIYNNTTSLGNAYGVCVMFVTFFDTSMVTLVALIVWRLPWYVVIVPWLIFACFDGTYLSSSLTKVPDGAWFTITLSIVLAAGFILWRYGKEAQWAAEASDRFPTSHFVTQDTEGNYRLKDKYGGEALSVTKGFGIFFDKAGEKTPIVFSNFITKLVSTPEVMVFFHMRPLEVPTVSDEARYTVTRLALPNCYRLVVRHGYMDEVVTPDLAAMIYGQISKYILQQQLPSTPTDDPIKTDDARSSSADEAQDDDEKAAGTRSSVVEVPLASSTIPAKLCQLRQAYEHRVLYILGKEEMNITAGTRLWRQLVLKMFLFLRENTRNKMANLAVPTDKLVEIGFVKDV